MNHTNNCTALIYTTLNLNHDRAQYRHTVTSAYTVSSDIFSRPNLIVTVTEKIGYS